MIVICLGMFTASATAVQGPVSESRFSENSELVNPEMRETLVFQFHKASSALLWVSYPGNILREPNLLAGRFSSTNPEFLLLLSWSLQTEGSGRHGVSFYWRASWCRGADTWMFYHSLMSSYLFERFRFSASSIIYINNILSPHIAHMTHRGHALSSEQILCIALRFFANGSFLYNVGDAEHVSKATVCRAVRNVTLALKRLLCTFVVFPSHRPTRLLKEEFHRIAGISLSSNSFMS